MGTWVMIVVTYHDQLCSGKTGSEPKLKVAQTVCIDMTVPELTLLDYHLTGIVCGIMLLL